MPGLDQAAFAACLERVLASPEFASADRLRAFLRFIVEQTLAGEGASLKESVIGVSVFDRSPGYDPKIDNIVRTSARRLRIKLDDYYAGEGGADPIRIELPKGSYVPVWRVAEEQSGPTHLAELIGVPAAAAAPLLIDSRGHYQRIVLYLIGVAALVSVCWIVFSASNRQSSVSWHSVPFSNLPGYQGYPSVSPDGQRIAFSWGGPENGFRHVYVQAIGSQSARRVTDGLVDELRPAWSLDGREIAFLRMGTGGIEDIYAISLDGSSSNGGQARKLATLQGRDPWLCDEPRLSWSPQGRELASVEANQPNGPCGVVLIDVPSGKKRWLTHPPKGEVADLEPAFSPDGKFVAFLRQSSASIADIFIVPSTGGEPRRLTSDDREVRGFAWSPDGKGFIVSSRRQGNFLNLWRLPFGRGNAVRLTESSLNLGFPSASRSGDRVAYVAYRDDSNIWRFSGASNQRWIESRSTERAPQYSPDGRRIAFLSDRTGNMDLWTADADGHNPVRITDFERFPVGSPAWSPDSRRLAFDVRIDGQSDIYLIDAQAGRKPDRLTKWPSNEAVPSWSRDGRSVYFACLRSGAWNVYRVPSSGGEPARVTWNGGIRALESPDGKFLYYTKSGASGIWRVALQPSVSEPGSQGEQLVLADFPALMWTNWAFGPRGLYYLARGPAGAGDPRGFIELLDSERQATTLLGRTESSPTDGGFSVSPDGLSFLYSQLDQSGSDILMLEH